MSTAERHAPKHGPGSATAGDMEGTIHGLRGIFWALNMLVVQHAADDTVHERDLREGIDALIVAGKTLADDISNRF